MRLKQTIVSLLLVGGAVFHPATVAEQGDAIWKAVHDNSFRTEEAKARDAARHPEEVLRFAGITEDMTVGEINPSSFWYTHIIASLVREKGMYVGLEHGPEHYAHMAGYAKRLAMFPDKVKENKELFGDKAVAAFIPAKEGLPVEAGSLDMVFSARSMHNWKRRGFFDTAVDQVWQMLKEGGAFVIVQHRAKEDVTDTPEQLFDKGRWKQSALVAALEERGFKLEAASEVNANPKDVGGYPYGVWNLPPSLSGDQEERDYKAIGESDRMTLKFVKVAK